MDKKIKRNSGVVLLISRYRKMFRVPENVDYYSSEDYMDAERKFIKMAVENGGYPFPHY